MITRLDPKKLDKKKTWVVSPSQITTWNRCQRWWGFQKIDGLPDPPGKGAILGTNTHNVLEEFFTHGVEPDVLTKPGKLAGATLRSGVFPDFSKPDNVLAFVEKHIAFSCEGVTFQGLIDLGWLWAGAPVISDHKTSSNPKKYGLTEATLPTDVQAVTYGVWGFDFFEVETLGLQWTYIQTADRVNPGITPVRVTVAKKATEENFRLNVLPVGKAIVEAKATWKTGNDGKPNLESCGDFGGCPFAVHCNKTRSEKLETVFGKQRNEMTKPTLREMLAQRGKLAPPRVNTPEHTAGVEAARGVSQTVEKVTGGTKAKTEAVRQIATAAAGENDPAAAKAKAEEALGVANADTAARAAPSLSQPEILIALRDGDRTNGLTISCSKPKSSASVPYVAGRTLSSLVKNSLIVSADLEDGTKRITLTSAGLDKAEKLQTPTTAPVATPTPPPINAAQPPAPRVGAVSVPAMEPRSNGAGKPVPAAPALHVGNPGAIQAFPADVPGVTPLYVQHAEFFRTLLSSDHVETEDAIAKFEAYCKAFPMDPINLAPGK